TVFAVGDFAKLAAEGPRFILKGQIPVEVAHQGRHGRLFPALGAGSIAAGDGQVGGPDLEVLLREFPQGLPDEAQELPDGAAIAIDGTVRMAARGATAFEERSQHPLLQLGFGWRERSWGPGWGWCRRCGLGLGLLALGLGKSHGPRPGGGP